MENGNTEEAETMTEKEKAAIRRCAPGLNKALARDKARRDAHHAAPMQIVAQPEWSAVEGVEVLRIDGSNFVAVPCTGRRNAREFDVINLRDRSEVVCTLRKNEVHGWLLRAA
jgi:hypothetical protein